MKRSFAILAVIAIGTLLVLVFPSLTFWKCVALGTFSLWAGLEGLESIAFEIDQTFSPIVRKLLYASGMLACLGVMASFPYLRHSAIATSIATGVVFLLAAIGFARFLMFAARCAKKPN